MNLKFGDVGRFLSFSINKSNARSIEYLHAFELTPSSSMLPYEPFLTVLREYLTQDDAEAALHVAGTPKRYGKLLLAWIFNNESDDYEPTLPSQYIYEQLIVTRAVASLLHKLASNHVIHLNITNTQYLSASSCNLLHNLDSDWPAQFGITLSLTPEALNAWWPTEDQQRYLKLRFRMSAALTQPDELASQYTLSVSTVPNTQTMKWADITYCGTELYALAEYLLHNKDCNTKDEAYSFYCNYMMLNAKTYSNSASDAHALINLLKAEDWAQYSPELIFSAHIAIFKSHVWFKNNADAFQTASQLLEWSEISGLPNQTLYAKFLHFWSLYLSGNFQYNHAEVKQLDEELQAIGWQQLRAAVISTFWFDLNAIQINGDYFLQRCQTARDIIALDNNPLAMATHCHHFSIIQQHLGDIEGAIASLSQSVELATPLGLTERMHHALNGKAYLLACCGEFDAAATTVLQALPLVIQDENHEQICTTLCNAAITTYFAGRFKDTISLIEEIFTIFHLRGILHTRHRSNFELRAIQSVCRLLMGNASVAIESHSISQREEPQSMEGSVTIKLMDLAVRLNQGHCINEEICTLIQTSRDIHHSN
ncbi:MAG: tetratricopeptide (TPR) repeat protein, partial [Reinekea sp.]